MKRRVIVVAVSVAALWLIAAWALVLPPFSPEPAFYENVEGGKAVYVCNGGEKGAPELPIRFSADGQLATVTVAGRDVLLKFSGVDWIGEIYSNGAWRLHLDPEANLSGPNGIGFSNCY